MWTVGLGKPNIAISRIKTLSRSSVRMPNYLLNRMVCQSMVSDSTQPLGVYSLPGSPVLGIFQARILEWVAIPFSRGSSGPRGQTQVSCTVGRFFNI